MPLTLAQVRDVCLSGAKADQCRFLAEDPSGNFYCVKQAANRAAIDDEVEEFKKRQLAQGVDPYTLIVPLGDHCQGYTLFRHMIQGYDVP